jgi:thiamine pyrophosphate-dependent acetolactate synthase large subunit-like protein
VRRFEPGFRKSVNRALYNVAVEVSVPAHGYGVYTFRWVPIGPTASANSVLERLLEEAKANEDKQPKEKERKADYHGEGDEEEEEEQEKSPEPEEARCALFQGLGRVVCVPCVALGA